MEPVALIYLAIGISCFVLFGSKSPEKIRLSLIHIAYAGFSAALLLLDKRLALVPLVLGLCTAVILYVAHDNADGESK